MQFKNSYIFLKREDKKEIIKKGNTTIIKLNPAFKKLLQKSFKEVKFNKNDYLHDFLQSGNFKINYKNSEYSVVFKYYNVWSNYYLDIGVNTTKKQEAVDILEIINKILIGSGNYFDTYYVSIISYDMVSEYYCNKLYPYFNEFERKLRQILFGIYTLNYNLKYYSATTDEEFQRNLKAKSNQMRIGNVPKEDNYIKQVFYALDYSDIDKLLFTKSLTQEETENLKEFLENNKDLSKLNDSDIRKYFEMGRLKTDWERFFGNKDFKEDFQNTLDVIREFRNIVAHCKNIDKDQYQKCKKILIETIKSLDNAISIMENKDFAIRNIELIEKSMTNLTKAMEKIIRIQQDQLYHIGNIINPLKEIKKHIDKINGLSF